MVAREETMKMIHSLLARMPVPVKLGIPLASTPGSSNAGGGWS